MKVGAFRHLGDQVPSNFLGPKRSYVTVASGGKVPTLEVPRVVDAAGRTIHYVSDDGRSFVPFDSSN